MKTTTRKIAANRAVDLRRMRQPPTHPGEMLLEEFLKPLGLTQAQAAVRIQMPPPETVRGGRTLSQGESTPPLD